MVSEAVSSWVSVDWRREAVRDTSQPAGKGKRSPAALTVLKARRIFTFLTFGDRSN